MENNKKKVVLAFSGGLDTSFAAKYLSEDLGYEDTRSSIYFQRNCISTMKSTMKNVIANRGRKLFNMKR